MSSLYINLLSYDYQRWQVIRACGRQWALVWLTVLPLLLGTGYWQWSRYRSSVVSLENIQRKHAPLEKLLKENEQLTARLAQLNQREELVLELSHQQPLVHLVGHISRAAAESGGGVSVRHFALSRRAPTPAETGREPAGANSKTADAEPRGTLGLEGVGVDNASVARFVAQLRTSGAFAEVHLTSTGPLKVNGSEARTYHMQCAY